MTKLRQKSHQSIRSGTGFLEYVAINNEKVVVFNRYQEKEQLFAAVTAAVIGTAATSRISSHETEMR
jgi:hypothetical protein